MPLKRLFTLLTVIALCTATLGFLAPAPLQAEEIEPRVERILKAMAEYLKEAGEYAFKAEITVDDLLPSGQKIQYAALYEAAVKRPDRIRTSYVGDLRETGVWYDGSTFTMLNKVNNFYAQWPAPGDIDGLLDKVEEKLGVRVPLSTLFHNDPYKYMGDGILEGSYAGLHLVGDTPCHHLLLSQKEVDVQVWIEEGRQLIPRKVVMTFKNIPAQPQFTAVFTEWDFNPRLSDLIFTFEPPPGTSKVEFKEVSP